MPVRRASLHALVGCGIAAAALVGLIWTSIADRDAMPDSQNDSRIDPPPWEGESRPARGATRARAVRNPGGLPPRDTSARAAQSTPVISAVAQRATIAPGASAHGAQPTSIDAAGARRELPIASAPADTANRSSERGDAGASPDEQRPRSRGIGGSVLEKSGAPAVGLPVGLKARRVFNGAPAAASSAPQNTITDERGAFAFGAVPDGEYEIRTEKNDRYESVSALVRAGTDSAVLVVEPTSQSTVSIHGVVESTSGGPLKGVRVDVVGQAAITAGTDATGAYALRVPADARLQQTTLRFRRAGYRDRRWAMTDGQRLSDYEVIGNVRLEPVAARVSVSGLVTSTDGTPVARAHVQLDSATRGRGYRTATDGAGRFTLADVDAGSDYRLWVRPQSGFKDGVLENLLVDAAMQPLYVALTPAGVATLRGRMVTPDGAPVPGFTMWLTSAYGAASRSMPVTTDAQGRFVVEDVPEGPVALQTRAAPALSVSGIHLSASADAAAAEFTAVVDVGPHRLEGRLLTSEGAPAPGARVSLEWSRSSGSVTSRSSRETITGSDGTFVFTQLGGGVHIVSATLAGAGGVRVEQPVGAGTQPVQITLPGKRGHQ